MERRVVVTGIGLVTPVGIGRDETWSAITAGTSGIAPITLFDVTEFATKFAGEVKNWEPTRWIEKRDAKTYDRFLQFGVVASQLAKDDAGLVIDEKNADRVGVYIGAGLGGVATIEKTHSALLEKGPRRGISPYFVPMIIVNMAPGLVSIRFGCKGPNFSHVSACSTGAHSIGEAMRAIQRDDCDAMFAGGCEATITRARRRRVQRDARACRRATKSRQRASRPFDLDRDGFVIAEGAGVLILEELETAKKRGAHIYCRDRRLWRVVGRALDGAAARRRRGRAALHEDGAARTPRWIPSASATSTRTAPRPSRATSPRPPRSRRCSASTPRSSRCRRPSR